MPLVMGVDSSTQSCKVELRDADSGQWLAEGTAPHPPTTPPVSEQDPAVWWQALIVALDRAIDSSKLSRRDIKAVAVAAQCHGLVLLDKQGQVLRPVKLWNDLTSAPQAEAMVAETGSDFWVEAVGSVPTASFTITKLAWMAEHEPDLLAQAARACVPHDWLTWKLCGQFVTDRSDASGTGYYCAPEASYRWDILNRFAGLDEATLGLPSVLGPDSPAGLICPQAAADLGLGPDVVIGPGGGDQHLASLGMGIVPGDVAFSLGTSGVVMAVSDDPVHDHAGFVDGVCDTTGRYLPLVCTLNATKVTDWFRELLGLSYAQFDDLALSVPVDQRRVTLAAFLDGERRPCLPQAVGLLAGFSTDTSRAQIARAAVDGVVMGLLEGFDAIERCGIPVDGRIIAIGGGSASAAYRQSLADFLDRPVQVLDAPGATVRGACLQAATVWRGARIDDLRDAWRPAISQTAEPGPTPPPETRQAYRRLAAWRGMDRS